MLYRSILALISSLALWVAPLLSAAPASAARFFSLTTTRQTAYGYTPAQIETAYGMSGLAAQGITGTGQTIALIELDTFRPSDIQQFDSANGLPSPVIQQFYTGGKRFKVGNAGETTMDLEWAHALAPAAKLQVFYINGKQSNKAGWKTLAQALTLAGNKGAETISMSFGSCRPSTGYKATETALAKLLKRGVSVFVSSGDDGALPGPVADCGRHLGVAYPASDPSVAAVGGTSLSLNPDNTISSETAWERSGGGKGSPLLHPLWQVIAQLPHPKYRWAPDVAFLADPRTGVAIYNKGRWQTAGGTSLGAPAWAAIWSLVRESAQKTATAVQPAPQALYSVANSPAYSQAFHDITVGGNGFYQATASWDPVTGWGTPDVAGLITAVADLTPAGRPTALPAPIVTPAPTATP